MNVLVTGASGKLGSFVIRELESAGHTLVLTSRRRPDAAERWPWVQGDIRNFDTCCRAVAGVDAVQHVAAQPFPTDHPAIIARQQGEPLPFQTTMESNILGTYYLLQACVRHNVGIVVMTGSNCALGHGFRLSGTEFPIKYLPIDEDHPTDVEDSYSFSKLAGEELLASYTRAYGIRTYALRSAGIRPPEARAAMATNARPAQRWDQWLWPWIGSEDIAVAHRLLMERAADIESHGLYFCNADDTTALEPTMELVERFRPDLLPVVRELPGHASLMSNHRLKEAVGWQPTTSWRADTR